MTVRKSCPRQLGFYYFTE